MDVNKLSVAVSKFIVEGWIVLKLRGGVIVYCKKKKKKHAEGRKRNRGGGEEGQSLGHKLSVWIQHHHGICLF
jgi:hypothetical protein